MTEPARTDFILGKEDRILVTGAAGFIGSRVVARLLELGFHHLRCFARPSGKASFPEMPATVEIFRGNLLSREDCRAATKDVALILHLAAGRGEKSFPEAYMNTVITTRNLLDGALAHGSLRRFVNVSSFAVYSNAQHGGVLDESAAVESHPERRGDAYCFAKVKQEQLVEEYAARYGVPAVTLRPGHVYGPGNEAISARVGIGTFGVFLHLGGANPIPLSYVDNCASAIVLAGLRPGIDGEIFNVIDDHAPSSRRFLRQYKKKVRGFRSVYIPHALSYALCWLWEEYSRRSNEQLPPVFNTRRWQANWKATNYSNRKLKARLGWEPAVSTAEGLARYYEACRKEIVC